MVLGLHSFPPLGRVSQVKGPTINFLVILELADHDDEHPWEICLWHSCGEQPWQNPAGMVLDMPDGRVYLFQDGTFFQLERR